MCTGIVALGAGNGLAEVSARVVYVMAAARSRVKNSGRGSSKTVLEFAVCYWPWLDRGAPDPGPVCLSNAGQSANRVL
jgi:hypothetical protein